LTARHQGSNLSSSTSQVQQDKRSLAWRLAHGQPMKSRSKT